MKSGNVLKVYSWMFGGGILGLISSLIVVYITKCGDVAAACWGGGLTNLGLLIGGLMGLHLIGRDQKLKKLEKVRNRHENKGI